MLILGHLKERGHRAFENVEQVDHALKFLSFSLALGLEVFR